MAIALVADQDIDRRRSLTALLSGAGWEVTEARDAIEAVDAAQRQPADVILLRLPDDALAVARLRAAPRRVASTPILAFVDAPLPDEALWSRGLDAGLPMSASLQDVVAEAARWRPDDAMGVPTRLMTAFGVPEMTKLIGCFRAQLAAAVGALGDGGSASEAHRIAGIAGTLGFARVSASWLRLSEGDLTGRRDARRDARLAIAHIDRDPRYADRA